MMYGRRLCHVPNTPKGINTSVPMGSNMTRKHQFYPDELKTVAEALREMIE